MRLAPKLSVVIAAAFLLCGCSMLDTVGGWFNGPGKVSKLKGQRISVMSMDESLRSDPTLADVPVVLPPPYVNAEWPQPGGYPSNAMYHLAAPGPLRQIWIQDAGKASDAASRLTAPPIVVQGKIYVLDSATHVYVFDAKTGSPIWDRSLAPAGQTSFLNDATFGVLGSSSAINPAKGFGGGVAMDGGRLFVTTGFGDVFALNPQTGKQMWKTTLDVPILNAPVVSGGRVFLSTQDNHFYALAAVDGRKLWDHQGIPESAGILESTNAAVAGEFVIVPYTSGELYALRVQNGRPAWNDMLTSSGQATALSELDDIAGRPVVDRDMVYAISHSGLMTAINLNTGDRAWARDVGGIQTPWAAGDFLYVLTTDQQVLCLTRKEGRVKWMHPLQHLVDPTDKTSQRIVWAGPVLVSDRLVLVSSQGFAVSLSPYTGDLLGKVEIPAAATIAPVVANGTLYIYTNDAQLVALR